ncbi:MAG: thioredoxin fold domain-containing protein [Ignavibacterium sp.]|nr:thioredoxin fold domain-containing protein [Ignavibacterium sp.]
MNLKLFISLTVITLFFISCKSPSTDNLKWEENLEIALKKAQDENKYVLINFTGSDWCIWCQRLSNEVFTQKEFENFAEDNLILVKIDFPKNIEQSVETKFYNNRLAQEFGVEGFPTIFILDKNGNMKLKTGYIPGGVTNYISYLKQYM